MMPSTYDDFSQRATGPASSTDEERRNAEVGSRYGKLHLPFFRMVALRLRRVGELSTLDQFESLVTSATPCLLLGALSFATAEARAKGSPCLTTPATRLLGFAFQMAKRQFEIIADHLGIAEGRPRSIHRDDGTIDVFRLPRSASPRGRPYQGRHRFAPATYDRRVRRVPLWMSWKCAGLPYGGAKGGVRVDPLGLSRRELELVSRRYLHEIIAFIGPQMDILGPDMVPMSR
jgi:hypothetical protein